jgi:hypothetical protein
MKQRVFGGYRVLGDDMLRIAGAAADGLEIVFPFDPTGDDPAWLAFNQRFEKQFSKSPEVFASLAYDTMNILLQSICRAGLNRGRIRDALTGLERYKGVTGEMVFDPNCKNIVPMYLATVKSGKYRFRRYPMQIPYAQVGENGVQYNGPEVADLVFSPMRIGLFGPDAERLAASLRPLLEPYKGRYAITAIPSEGPWGKASHELVKLIYEDQALGLIATGRNASHLAEQLAVKAFVPLIAISSDHSLTAVNIPWVFRLPPDTSMESALRCFIDAAEKAGANRGRLREALASGAAFGGDMRFASNGELQTR